MNKRDPNLFILGAPKSGTTALTAYLRDHPGVFLAPVKDTDYFATDYESRTYRNEAAYWRLYRDVPSDVTVIGESATRYLESTEAVPHILNLNPQANFIVMLRNPMQMAPALHAQMIWEGVESELDFSLAWQLNDSRRNGQRVPLLCKDSKLVCYRDACLLGSFMQRLLKQVDRDRLLVIYYDDFKRDPAAIYARALDFLGLAIDSRTTFPVVNARKRVQHAWLQKSLLFLGLVKRRLGITRGLGIHNRLKFLIFSEQPSNDLSSELLEDMRNAFREDIQLLERLTSRNLSHWVS